MLEGNCAFYVAFRNCLLTGFPL